MQSLVDLVLENAATKKSHKFEHLSLNTAVLVFTLGSKFAYLGT